MTKREIALCITRAIYKNRRNLETFNAYQSIQSYLLALEMGELTGIARQYGITYHWTEGL